MRQMVSPAGGSGPLFGGWYLKHWGEEGGIALIPAFHRERRGELSASLQIITPGESRMVRYPAAALEIWPEGFQVRLGSNWFSREGVHLDVEAEGLSLRGELRYGPFDAPRRDIMGPFVHLPHMQCVHGILSMDHRVDGVVALNGETLQFINGQGYAESDRGRSFPRRYLWVQGGWRERQKVEVMLAVAHIPLPVGGFTGCICQIGFAGRHYRLATYEGAAAERWDGSGAVVRQGKLRLEVEVLEREDRPLRAPAAGRMERTVHESLFAVVRFRLWEGEELLLDHTDGRASFEFSEEEKKRRRKRPTPTRK